MPVVCNSNALTGSSGAVYYTPSATHACLLAADFDGTANTIAVGGDKDFRVGDPVVFSVKGDATLDGKLTAGDTYYVTSVTADKVQVSATKGGDAVELSGDGEDNGGHVEMRFNPAQGICEVREWSCSMTRESLDVTTLPCAPACASGGQKWAATKRFQPGYAEITGTLTLYITDNDQALATRLMESTFLNNQEGASVKLYVDLESDGATPPMPDDSASQLIAGDVMFTDFSTSVNPDDPTQAEVSFTMYNVTHWIGQEINR